MPLPRIILADRPLAPSPRAARGPSGGRRRVAAVLARCAVAAMPALLTNCAPAQPPQASSAAAAPTAETLVDATRARSIPILVYGAGSRPKPIALISHGYGGRNAGYSFLAHHLARRGFVVASVQHELESDAPLPTQGIPAVVRRPSWQQGVDNLTFVAATMRARGIGSGAPVVLVGHSHGGDASMLMAEQQPNAVRAVFSLDSRRMRFPRTRSPRICSVRSVDQVADPGVLPDPREAADLGMVIATVPGLEHNNMWDAATPEQRHAVLQALDSCLGTGRRT